MTSRKLILVAVVTSALLVLSAGLPTDRARKEGRADKTDKERVAAPEGACAAGCAGVCKPSKDLCDEEDFAANVACWACVDADGKKTPKEPKAKKTDKAKKADDKADKADRADRADKERVVAPEGACAEGCAGVCKPSQDLCDKEDFAANAACWACADADGKKAPKEPKAKKTDKADKADKANKADKERVVAPEGACAEGCAGVCKPSKDLCDREDFAANAACWACADVDGKKAPKEPKAKKADKATRNTNKDSKGHRMKGGKP